MYYSIGDVSNTASIAISTLRYFDREGVFVLKKSTKKPCSHWDWPDKEVSSNFD